MLMMRAYYFQQFIRSCAVIKYMSREFHKNSFSFIKTILRITANKAYTEWDRENDNKAKSYHTHERERRVVVSLPIWNIYISIIV